MGAKEILEFVKVEHTLFSLPFVLIGFILAQHQFGSESMDIIWILVAAVGARGLAMALGVPGGVRGRPPGRRGDLLHRALR